MTNALKNIAEKASGQWIIDFNEWANLEYRWMNWVNFQWKCSYFQTPSRAIVWRGSTIEHVISPERHLRPKSPYIFRLAHWQLFLATGTWTFNRHIFAQIKRLLKSATSFRFISYHITQCNIWRSDPLKHVEILNWQTAIYRVEDRKPNPPGYWFCPRPPPPPSPPPCLLVLLWLVVYQHQLVGRSGV